MDVQKKNIAQTKKSLFISTLFGALLLVAVISLSLVWYLYENLQNSQKNLQLLDNKIESISAEFNHIQQTYTQNITQFSLDLEKLEEKQLLFISNSNTQLISLSSMRSLIHLANYHLINHNLQSALHILKYVHANISIYTNHTELHTQLQVTINNLSSNSSMDKNKLLTLVAQQIVLLQQDIGEYGYSSGTQNRSHISNSYSLGLDDISFESLKEAAGYYLDKILHVAASSVTVRQLDQNTAVDKLTMHKVIDALYLVQYSLLGNHVNLYTSAVHQLTTIHKKTNFGTHYVQLKELIAQLQVSKLLKVTVDLSPIIEQFDKLVDELVSE